jgi:hypothetical protein
VPPRDLDLTSLVAGIALALTGVAFLLDATGVLAVGVIGALSLVLVGVGATVVAGGIARARGR